MSPYGCFYYAVDALLLAKSYLYSFPPERVSARALGILKGIALERSHRYPRLPRPRKVMAD